MPLMFNPSSGLPLARRLEAAEAANGVCCAEAQEGSAVKQVAGGCAIFVGANSMLTHAIGLGLDGPVTAAEVDRMESFFRSRGAAANVDLCPYAHPTLTGQLSRRGYRAVEFNNILVRSLRGAGAGPGDARIRAAGPGEAGLWAQTVGAGFFERDQLAAEEIEVGLTLFRARGVRCFFGCPERMPAAAAAMSSHDGVALLFADSTIQTWRGKGLHAALIRARLDEAIRAGCDLAAAGVLPGSVSERNYHRLGFQVAYTRVVLTS